MSKDNNNHFRKLSDDIGTPSHIDFLRKNDDRRHKSRCIYYDKSDKKYHCSKCCRMNTGIHVYNRKRLHDCRAWLCVAVFMVSDL